MASREKKKQQKNKCWKNKLYHEKNNQLNREYRIFYKRTGLESSKNKCHEIKMVCCVKDGLLTDLKRLDTPISKHVT